MHGSILMQRPYRKLALGALTSALLIASPGLAEAPVEDYFARLQAAQRKVERTRTLPAAAASLGLASTLAKPGSSRAALTHPYPHQYQYQVGDTWEVVAWHFDSAQMRKTATPETLHAAPRFRPGRFLYEVIEGGSAPAAPVKIRITQREGLGFAKIDARVKEMRITLDRNDAQNEKVYFMTDRERPVGVSPDGIRARISPLELYPLDVPEIRAAERTAVTALPELRSEVRPVYEAQGLAPDFAKSRWFEQDDFFGRPVRALWQEGAPWPHYVATPLGIAILVRRGGA